ncbi:MAG: OB-fold nucleic acid binding domain-containing protein, partial [Planctomycetota bacterium]
SLSLDRQGALWGVRSLRRTPAAEPDLFSGLDAGAGDGAEALPRIAPLQEVIRDYRSAGLSLKDHPVRFLREDLERRGARTAAELLDPERSPNGARVAVAGLVLVRQRPATAKGIIFITLEDETGVANLVVHPKTYERHRADARHGVVLFVRGKIDRAGTVVHVVANRIEAIDGDARGMRRGSRDFH